MRPERGAGRICDNHDNSFTYGVVVIELIVSALQ